MKNITFYFLLCCASFCSFGQGIFDSSIHTATNFGSINSPFGEGVQNIIDQNSSTKFLDFNGFDGIGFDVDLLGVSQTARSIAFVSANDAPERDPNTYQILGSNDGANFTSIATGNIPCISTRLFSRTFSFTNTIAYSYYRVNLTGTCASSAINQVADVQLFGSIGNTPTFNCPSSITSNSDAGTCGAIVNFNITASDTEDGSLMPVLVSGFDSGMTFPLGNTSVLYAATDSDGNTVSCAFDVTVTDAELPVISCPANIMANSSSGNPVVVNYSITADDNCDLINPLAGFTPLATINNKSYYLSNNTFFPQNAFNDAIAQGGFVGTIRNAFDNDLLTATVLEKGSGVNALLGYTDAASEGTFVWQSLDNTTYTNWNFGEPNNAGSGGSENYTILLSSGVWNDVDNNTQVSYILELDYAPLQTSGLEGGSAFPVGTTTNTFEIYDISGNTISCSFDVIVSSTASIDDSNFDTQVFIIPNPVQDQFSIINNSDTVLKSALIYDMSGRQVRSIKQMTSSIDVTSLLSGIYFIKIENQENKFTVKQLIKK
ncbi:MAG: hypothetical protein ACJAXY_001537 [Nonlabens sp.]|jgi:hypothetical protein|uniref:HYR domain-containing protein n=1 Tax=Nonlabens sp. TaxID=1888209 RepID=UPI0039E562E1